MRLHWPAICALALVVVLPPATAHEGDHSGHLSVMVGTLEAGQQRDIWLDFREGPLQEDWMFLAYGGVNAGSPPVSVAMYTAAGIRVTQWAWTQPSFLLSTTRVPETNEYYLNLSNPAPEPARYAFYFDQSCNCLDKSVGINGGWVVFNFDLAQDQHVVADFNIGRLDPSTLQVTPVSEARVEATVALRTNPRSTWPTDYSTITQAGNVGPRLRLEWTTETTDRYYVMVQVKQGAEPSAPLNLLPTISSEPATESTAGGLAIIGLLLVLAGTAYVRHSERRH